LTAGVPVEPGPIDVRIGGNDDLNVVRFHARERSDEVGAYRWTGPQSFIVLTGLAPAARELTLWMSHGGRPASAPPAVVEVALGDDVIGNVSVTEEMAPHTLPLPTALVERLAAQGDPVRLRLRVATWNPGVLLGVPDTRDLGVMVTRVQVP
jgi:hypothetical protein